MTKTTVPINLIKLKDGGFHLFFEIVVFYNYNAIINYKKLKISFLDNKIGICISHNQGVLFGQHLMNFH